MAGTRNKDPGNTNSVAINTFSRVIAVAMLTLLFGVGGHYLDRWLGSNFWTIVGFILGGCLTMIGLLYVVKAAEFDRKNQRQTERGSPEVEGETNSTGAHDDISPHLDRPAARHGD